MPLPRRAGSGIRLGVGFAGCVVLIASASQGLAAATPDVSFKGARLGMTIGEWRSLAPPAGAGPDAIAACSRDRTVSQIAGNFLSAAERRTGMQTCAYVSRFGDEVLPHTVSLDASYRISGLRYLFEGGRLDRIRFEASIDAYSDVMALLTGEFGAPVSTQRDRVRSSMGGLTRVRQTWRAADGAEIVLTDPVAPFTKLEVDFTQPAAQGAAAAPALASAGGNHH